MDPVSLEHAQPQAIVTPAAEENGATSANGLSLSGDQRIRPAQLEMS